ncbi:MAG: type II secretion system secretin GspD, partial [bacterium]
QFGLLFISSVIVVLSGCSGIGTKEKDKGYEYQDEKPLLPIVNTESDGNETYYASQPDSNNEGFLDVEKYPGTGEFINVRAASRAPSAIKVEGEVTLNFEGEDVQEVARLILGDIMKENYVIGPGVSGKVTFSTAKPIDEKQLMSVLEMLLGWNGASMIYRDGRYMILPTGKAVKGNLIPRVGSAGLIKGYDVRAIPLKYISATEMQKLLEPYAKDGAILSADNARSLLILAGTKSDMNNYLQTIEIFDVDWLASMSVGLFPLDRVDAETVLPELDKVFGESAGTPLAGMFRFMPMERLNAIMVITPQPEYLEQAELWIKRLDRGGSEAGARLYVYAVKNVKAVDLSDTLNQVFTGNSSSTKRSSKAGKGSVAPGLKPVEIKSGRVQTKNTKQKRNPSAGTSVVGGEDISITAVEESNSLLIKATPQEYDSILSAIKKLDQIPLQVFIEAKLIEVQLDGSFSHGIQWFFEDAIAGVEPASTSGKAGIFEHTSEAGVIGQALNFGASASYTFTGPNAKAIINFLQSNSKTRTVSSPSLLVLNNKTAHINIGDQIPVNTQSFNPVGGANNSITSVQFRDTGVTLDVTPRVNPGGLVFMEVKQDVSNPTENADSNGNKTVTKRTIETEVAVQSGNTIVLAGLMDHVEDLGESGAPGLHKIPIIGSLFGQKRTSGKRKELIVFITPTVIRSSEEALTVTKEYRRRFKSLKPIELPKTIQDHN